MRGTRSRGRGIPSFAILLLLSQLFKEQNRRGIPPVTLAWIVGLIVIYFRVIPLFWSRNLAVSCLSASKILFSRDYVKLFVSQIEHAQDGGWHLYYNVVSFLVKGRTLEGRFGSTKYLTMLLIFTGLTGISYVGLNYALFKLLEDHSYMDSCAVGFSGVIFALKVLTTHDISQQGNNVQLSIFGVPIGTSVNAKYSVWFELVLISIIAPNASFVGHLGGILVGLAYVYGPLKPLVDSVHGLVFEGQSPFPRAAVSGRFTRTSEPTGYRTRAPPPPPPAPPQGQGRPMRPHETTPPPGSGPSTTFRSFRQPSQSQPYGYWTPEDHPIRRLPRTRSPSPRGTCSPDEIRRRRLNFYAKKNPRLGINPLPSQ